MNVQDYLLSASLTLAVLGTAWKLGSQLSAISTKLDNLTGKVEAHQVDDTRFHKLISIEVARLRDTIFVPRSKQ